MTPNQRVFADEYIKTRNATRAYLKAYPTCKNENVAAAASTRMLRNVKVAEYIDEQLDKLHNHSIADASEAMQFLTSVMRGEVKDEVQGDGGGIIELRVKATERVKAANQLVKLLGADEESKIKREELQLRREEFELKKRDQVPQEEEHVSDGFYEALNETGSEVWTDDEGDTPV